MKHLLILVAFILCGATHAAPPTAQSVAKLLEVMHVEQTTAAVLRSTEAFMRNSATQVLKGKTLTPEQTAQAESMRAKFVEILKEELSWEKMQPMNVRIYAETFSQEEVNGLIAFYQSPIGESYIAKMPIAMQKSMTLMQERLGPMMQRFAQITKEAAEASGAPKNPQ